MWAVVSVTVDQVMGLGPCYPRYRVEQLFGGRASVTPAEIARASIPETDREWVLLRLAPREVWLPAVYRAADRTIRYACNALDAAGLGDAAESLACGAPPIVDQPSAVAAAWAAGAARDAAVAAGAAGAARAAGAAAMAAMAARAAARAARAAARAAMAARAAARDAAWDAAWAAEYQLYLDDLASCIARAED